MKLWVIRHAKSSWADQNQTDFERPLNERGLRDAPRMQAWLAKQSHLPQWIVSSDALRTRQTSIFIHAALVPTTPLLFDNRLYLPTLHDMFDLLAETPAEITSLALISHNPASTHIINSLVGSAVINNLPTFGIARLTIKNSWDQISEGTGTLDVLVSPKTI
ncbi:MAG: histidine phosphatase family protein [Pseudomonadales bacterium]|nr:histidine phosphatase family protein [Pseudomonadales bacterium]